MGYQGALGKNKTRSRVHGPRFGLFVGEDSFLLSSFKFFDRYFPPSSEFKSRQQQCISHYNLTLLPRPVISYISHCLLNPPHCISTKFCATITRTLPHAVNVIRGYATVFARHLRMNSVLMSSEFMENPSVDGRSQWCGESFAGLSESSAGQCTWEERVLLSIPSHMYRLTSLVILSAGLNSTSSTLSTLGRLQEVKTALLASPSCHYMY